ncbi:LruC domain-containing protein [Vibrio sp. FNV 38]|nr:LruC domain-containing protein [Vibrio sp. FNV 38]
MVGLALMGQSAYSVAAPFDNCPSQAYLFQSKPVQVYGLNLVTGQSTLLQGNTGTTANVNGVGFDFDSRYIYGYDTTNKKIVRLGKDFQVEDISTSGLPTDHTFYVGDVFNKHYFLYRKGKGLFKIDLSPLDSNPNATLDVIKISSNATVNLTDMAFNPVDEKLYGVDNSSGMLYQFDNETGASTPVGDTGETGTFGAGYFDVNGYYYLSRNQDGHVFRIDLSSQDNITNGNVTAVKFADGPASGQNDGARCAYAPLLDENSTIDFGDAPDTYLTTLASNGARHALDGVTFLGSQSADADLDAQIAPLSDDTSGIDDEDGINFVTAIEPGLDSVLQVTASTQGYLTAWFDWNQDGDFDDAGEHVIQDQLVDEGQQNVVFNVDYNALPGVTWARFRFSQQEGLNYYGGAISGEVEDHQVAVTGQGITVRHFPSETGYATLAYEDNWPYTADYDMNDVVMHYRVTEILRDGNVERSYIRGRLAAVGADYHNGFAVRLKGVQRADIDQVKTRQFHNDALLTDSGLELDSQEAIFIISPDVTVMKGDCAYHRTQTGCKETEQFMFELHVSINEGTDTSSMLAMPYDPFIYATPGYYHGEGLPLHPGRQWEVHLPDYAPTEKFNGEAMWNLGVDASIPQDGVYFKTAGNLPWAMLMTEEWLWPTERTDLVQAYPEFAQYAESAGSKAQNWHNRSKAISSKIYE